MNHQHNHPTTPNLRRRLICGATAALLAEGCTPDLTHVTDEQMYDIRSRVEFGNEYIAPVLLEMAHSGNGECIFGVDGESGADAFERGLELTIKNSNNLLESEEFYTFYDINYGAGAYYNYRLNLFAINTAYLYIPDSDDIQDRQEMEYGIAIEYPLFIHEFSHEYSHHTYSTNQYTESDAYGLGDSSSIYQELIVNDKDFAYLLEYSSDELDKFLRYSVLNFIDGEKAWLETLIESKNDHPEVYECYQQEAIERISTYQTPEGWSSLMVEKKIGLPSFITAYWNVSIDEQIRIYAESGWYEEFIEEGVEEITSEIKREFGSEFVEGRLREMEQYTMQEHIRKSRELDGYNQEMKLK
jgi:hypothetical protein